MGYSKKPTSTKGFKIGKKPTGGPGQTQSIYLGKAQKIKQTLIHKAKLKKQRAKELIKAGYIVDTQNNNNNKKLSNSEINHHQNKPSSSNVISTSSDNDDDDDDELNDNKKTFSKNLRHSHQSTSPCLKNQHQDQDLTKSSFIEEFNNTPSIKKINPIHNNNNNQSKKLKKLTYHHPNGQPKLSHRVSKILNKLQRP